VLKEEKIRGTRFSLSIDYRLGLGYMIFIKGSGQELRVHGEEWPKLKEAVDRFLDEVSR